VWYRIKRLAGSSDDDIIRRDWDRSVTCACLAKSITINDHGASTIDNGPRLIDSRGVGQDHIPELFESVGYYLSILSILSRPLRITIECLIANVSEPFTPYHNCHCNSRCILTCSRVSVALDLYIIFTYTYTYKPILNVFYVI
jgi:hypothetical protein